MIKTGVAESTDSISPLQNNGKRLAYEVMYKGAIVNTFNRKLSTPNYPITDAKWKSTRNQVT